MKIKHVAVIPNLPPKKYYSLVVLYNFIYFLMCTVSFKTILILRKKGLKHLPSIRLVKAGAFDPYPGVFFSWLTVSRCCSRLSVNQSSLLVWHVRVRIWPWMSLGGRQELLIDWWEGVPLPPSVEGGRYPLDVDRLCHAPLEPVGFLVQDGDTPFVDRMSPVVHVVTDWRGRAVVFLEASIQYSFRLTHIIIRTVITLYMVHHPRFF